MKKIILPLVAVLVFGISIYTVVNYNKNKEKNLTITTKENSTIEKDSSTEKDIFNCEKSRF